MRDNDDYNIDEKKCKNNDSENKGDDGGAGFDLYACTLTTNGGAP